MTEPEVIPPLRIVRIQVFQSDEDSKKSFSERIAQAIEDRYVRFEVLDSTMKVSKNRVSCMYRTEEIDGLSTLVSIIDQPDLRKVKNEIYNVIGSFDLSSLKESEKGLLSASTILIPAKKGASRAAVLIEEYSKQLSKPKLGIGIVRGCLFSILDPGIDVEGLFDQYYILSPHQLESRTAEKRVDEVVDELKQLTVLTAELSRLHRSCAGFFASLKPGETEINRKTEEFLWDLMFSTEPVTVETLESWVSYTMEKASTLSTMIVTIQERYIESELIISGVENLLKKLNEKTFEDYPKNFEILIETYNRVKQMFKNYILRTEALNRRLGTVREEIRTYLSLQQQNIAIEEQRLAFEEQKAAKEQLVRLVNLQEIFHKVEIFIVAVYITEMAKIIFEVLLHEMANFLTACFIPVALILAVGVSRLLHREHENILSE